MPAPAYCPHCFYALDADAVTCPRCGQPVGNTDVASPALTGAAPLSTTSGPGQELPSPEPPPAVYARYVPPSLPTDPATNRPGAPEPMHQEADLAAPTSLPAHAVDAVPADSSNGDLPATSLPVRPARNDTAVMPFADRAEPIQAAPAPSLAASVPPEAAVVPAPGAALPPVPLTDLPSAPVAAAPPEGGVMPVPGDAPVPVWTTAPAPPPVAGAAGAHPAASSTAGAMVLLPGEEVITQLGALYLTNKRVILYAPSILRAAFLRDVDAVGTLTERASGWSLFLAILFLVLAAVSAFVMLTQNQVAFSVGSAIQLPMWLLALGFAALGGVLLGTYFFWVKKSLFLSVGGRPLIVISLSGWSPKRLEGVDAFINTFSQAKDAVEYPQEGR